MNKNNDFSKIRIIASDLDGTLVRSDDKVSEYTCDVLRRYEEAGGKFIICTGRASFSLEKILPTVPVNAPAVCSNGAQVINPLTGEYYLCESIDMDTLCRIISMCYENHIDFSCVGADQSEIVNRPEEENGLFKHVAPKEVRATVISSLTPENVEMLSRKKIFKMLCYIEEEWQMDKLSELSGDGKNFVAFRSTPEVAELAPGGCDKGTGLRLACEIAGTNASECCAFGDYGNDKFLLTSAGMSVCMANGTDEIKSCADFICPSNDEDGVARFIEEHFLSD